VHHLRIPVIALMSTDYDYHIVVNLFIETTMIFFWSPRTMVLVVTFASNAPGGA